MPNFTIDPIVRSEKFIFPCPMTGCWLWGGFRDPKGYGRIAVTVNKKHSQKMAHRVLYEHYKGPIPEGFQIDHLCRVRGCVNPNHLEVVTLQENISRGLSGQFHANKTHCPKGHAYTPENTKIQIRGKYTLRTCKICYKESNLRGQAASNVRRKERRRLQRESTLCEKS